MFAYTVLLGIALGISLAGPPGPITSIIVIRSRTSALSGFVVGLGAMTADFSLMLVVFTFYSLFSTYNIDFYLYPLGATVFAFMGVLILKSAEGSKAYLQGNGYLLGLELGLINPFQVAWWAGAGLSVLEKFGILPFYFLFLGIIIWIAFLSFTIFRSVLKYGKRLSEALRVSGAIVQLAFSAIFLYLWVLIL